MRALSGAGVRESRVGGAWAFATTALGTASGCEVPVPTSPVATATTATALQMEPAVDASGSRPRTGVWASQDSGPMTSRIRPSGHVQEGAHHARVELRAGAAGDLLRPAVAAPAALYDAPR